LSSAREGGRYEEIEQGQQEDQDNQEAEEIRSAKQNADEVQGSSRPHCWARGSSLSRDVRRKLSSSRSMDQGVLRWSAPASNTFSCPVPTCGPLPTSLVRRSLPCAHDNLGSDKPSAACAAFLKSSERAQQQWELERRFTEFESAL